MTSLADRQAALVAALVAGAPVPPGFDESLVDAAARALLRKRAGLAARSWPVLAAVLGTQWIASFGAFHRGRPSNGPLRDGWDLARSLAASGRLPDAAAEELAAREALLRYDGRTDPRPRRLPHVARIGPATVVAAFGRPRSWSSPTTRRSGITRNR